MKKYIVAVLFSMFSFSLYASESMPGYENKATIKFYEFEKENDRLNQENEIVNNLPKTGDKSSDILVVFGTLIVAIILLFVFRKKEGEK
ncbi:hypothetical protein A7N94_01635 [Listeria monocytogenes]|uniref:LPXTG cell wall anchor domain-containing protein n=1 Tax=Listeria monocytogenes TaxID=1639 RepID=UPI000BDF4C19|nr:LPXTG cell wall anchor domain-containing protein [Listeria monocytogenes]PCW48138.1 hypothetical protein A7N94_01635 [Listeria monocytogenes]RJA01325.1 LPXTG cell wall anchor domain-containing protein [Listeria monocytogenes]